MGVPVLIWIGVFQMLAMIPGTSRSGATIIGCLLYTSMKVRNLGRKSLEEVLAKLKELNLELNQGEE